MKKKLFKTGMIAMSLAAVLGLAGCGSTPQEKIQKATGITQQQATETLDTLKSMGVSDQFEEVKKFDKMPDTYEFYDKTYGKIYFSVPNGKLNNIINSSGIYLYKDGSKANDLEAVTFKSGEDTEFQIAARKSVKAKLKDPSSADFEDEQVQKVKDEVVCSGKVIAKNSFGANVQHGYIVIMDYKTKETKSVDFT